MNLQKLRSSFENLVDTDDNEPLVTFPDESPCVSEISSPTNQLDTLKFEQKMMNNFKKTKVSNNLLCKNEQSEISLLCEFSFGKTLDDVLKMEVSQPGRLPLV